MYALALRCLASPRTSHLAPRTHQQHEGDAAARRVLPDLKASTFVPPLHMRREQHDMGGRRESGKASIDHCLYHTARVQSNHRLTVLLLLLLLHRRLAGTPHTTDKWHMEDKSGKVAFTGQGESRDYAYGMANVGGRAHIHAPHTSSPTNDNPHSRSRSANGSRRQDLSISSHDRPTLPIHARHYVRSTHNKRSAHHVPHHTLLLQHAHTHTHTYRYKTLSADEATEAGDRIKKQRGKVLVVWMT